MLLFIFFVGLIIAPLPMTKADESLYPDVSCHPLNQLTEGGIGGIRYKMDTCRNPDFLSYRCYKACVFQEHGILKNEYPTANEMHYMGPESGIFSDLFANEHIRSQIAATIVSECSGKLTQANENKIPCEDREEFYKCVENSWKC